MEQDSKDSTCQCLSRDPLWTLGSRLEQCQKEFVYVYLSTSHDGELTPLFPFSFFFFFLFP
jgi:hypothetical protein